MRMFDLRRVMVAIALVAAVGCSVETGGTAQGLTGPGIVTADVRPLSMVVGSWTGVETASVGESGTLTATFTQSPAPDGVVAATLSWTSAKTALTYTGTLSGTLDAMVITATNYGCGYTAQATLNAAGTQISGAYQGTGPSPCPSKAGTFVLTGTSYVPQCAAVSYAGPATFTLPNSSDATELSYVQANVSSTLTGAGKTDLTSTSWVSDGNYAVVLVKSATTYTLYVNVHTGDVLQSPSINNNGQQQAISHISRFVCSGTSFAS